MRIYTKTRTSLVILTAVGACWVSAGTARAVTTLTTLASFNSTNGAHPYAGLTLSGSTLYGTTEDGGLNNYGTVFSLPLSGGSPTTLATFNSTNGGYPQSAPTLSGSKLYGTTSRGGASGDGTVFSVPLSGGSPTTLATFNYTNGDRPVAGLILSGSTLYGTTEQGGANVYYGTVFSVPVGGGSPTTLASFNNTNGASSVAGLTLSGSTLYGTTQDGGASDYGTVFSLPLTGGSPTTLGTFNNSNGSYPLYGSLTLSGSKLYGTTELGGTSGHGTVFSIPLSGGSPTTLAAFNITNGTEPLAGVTLSGTTLYGTTSGGGPNNYGTVFSLPIAGGSPTTMATFNNTNGLNPSGLILSGTTLYGTTYYGGANGYGTVFAVTTGNSVTVSAGLTTHFTAIGGTIPTAATTAGLSIQAGGKAVVDPATPHTGRQLLVVNSPGLSVAGSKNAWTGLLDLTNNDMDLAVGSLADVTNQLAQGYAGGTWNGSGGIISTSATTNSTHLTALGVIQNNQSGTAIYTVANPFDGTTPGTSDILVKYTYYGDANLDGKVDGSDYSRIDNAYLANRINPTANIGWFNGDFNYDSVINSSDYTLIDNAFNTQGGNLSTTALIAVVTSQLVLTSPVPEPVSLPLLMFGGLALDRRRRKLTKGDKERYS